MMNSIIIGLVFLAITTALRLRGIALVIAGISLRADPADRRRDGVVFAHVKLHRTL